MVEAATLALRDLFAPPFRVVLFKSLALTLGLLAVLGIMLQWLVSGWVTIPYPWLDATFSVVAGSATIVGLAFLVAPATALFAGLFLDDIAEVVERTHYPAQVGRALPLGRSLATTLKFFGVVVVVNAIALPLVIFVGFGFLVFLLANAYLLGREYFALAALRFHDERTARALRVRHSGRIFGAGLLVAGLLLVPFANLLAPLFATALMVHLHKRVAALEQRRGGLLRA